MIEAAEQEGPEAAFVAIRAFERTGFDQVEHESLDKVFSIFFGFPLTASIAIKRLPIGLNELAQGIDGSGFSALRRIDDKSPAGCGEECGSWFFR